MRIHRQYVWDGSLIPGAFRDRDGAMSTDWERYSTPQETQERGRTPTDNGVIRMLASNVRAVDQVVEHTPEQPGVLSPEDPGNRAHTDVIGEKTEYVRLMLLRASAWMIPIPQENARPGEGG